MQGLSSMDNEASEKLHEDILSDEIDDIINSVRITRLLA